MTPDSFSDGGKYGVSMVQIGEKDQGWGDKTINYGRVLEIMGLLSGSGFTKVALISEPYKER